MTAINTPHKLAWYYGEPSKYSDLLNGKIIWKASILLGEGVGIRFYSNNEPRPIKHQFLIEFEDHTAMSTAIQMYGEMGSFLDGELDLFGHAGGYKTILCKNTVNKPCPACGTIIKKEAYIGGSIYYCEKCQKL